MRPTVQQVKDGNAAFTLLLGAIVLALSENIQRLTTDPVLRTLTYAMLALSVISDILITQVYPDQSPMPFATRESKVGSVHVSVGILVNMFAIAVLSRRLD